MTNLAVIRRATAVLERTYSVSGRGVGTGLELIKIFDPVAQPGVNNFLKAMDGATVLVKLVDGTAATVYDATGAVIANPVTTDVAGRINAYVHPGRYQLFVSDPFQRFVDYMQPFEAAVGG